MTAVRKRSTNTGSAAPLLPEALAAFALAGAPIAIAPDITLQYETTPKLVVLLFSTAALLCCYRAWWPGLVTLANHFRGRLLFGLFGTQAVFICLATVFSAQPGLSLSGNSWRRYGLVAQLTLLTLALLVAALAAARPQLRIAIAGIACAAGLIATYAIAQDLNWDPLLATNAYTIKYWNGELRRGPGTLGHAVYLGSFLATVIPLVLALATRSRRMLKFVLFGVAAAAFLALFLSGSRSALIALVLAGLLSLPLVRRISPRAWLAGGLVCTALIGAFVFPLRSAVALHIDRWRQDFYGGPRLWVWRESLAMAAARPLLGSGPDTFANEFRRRESARLARLYPDFTHESPHNLLLDGITAQGYSFPLIVLGLVFLVFAPSAKPPDSSLRALRAAFAASLVSLCFVSITICGALMLFILPAWLTGAGIRSADRAAPEPPRPLRFIAWGAAAALVFASLLIVGQDMAYKDLERAAASGRFEEMSAAYERSRQYPFPAAGDDLWCSRQFAAVARQLSQPASATAWSRAAEAAARAEETSDSRADAAYQSALIAIGMNQTQPAAAALRRAIAWAPTWYRPHLLLAQLLHYIGPASEAESEATLALDLSGTSRATVQQALTVQ